MLNRFFDALVLHCMKQLNGERSIYAIYHLLKGKKSSQTIQDSHLFNMTDLFGSYLTLNRETLEQSVLHLQQASLIEPVTKENQYILTSAGEVEMYRFFSEHPYPIHLQGWNYINAAPVFWGRLNLMIQSLSNIINRENRFYPIERNGLVQDWVRRYLIAYKGSRTELSGLFFSELAELLDNLDPRQSSIFVRRLSGYNRAGKTYEQIAKEFMLDILYVRYLFQDTIHFILSESSANSRRYPYLCSLASNLDTSGGSLTVSAKATMEFLKQGMNLEQIAKMRNLKVSTIEDHLVEIVLADKEFPIDDYVSESISLEIEQTSKMLNTKKLKAIKEELSGYNVSFFQIRLVLAKAGDSNES
ncbi:helix-turn-helix domain-containing protein [Peribacillus sp. SCS-155]|uniref:helix-turn-helix domain-containing protein n=1 Tax=Peribacillus sedimenti TaxID=3115297 RepID=UPI003906CB06